MLWVFIEKPYQGASNENPQHYVFMEKENIDTFLVEKRSCTDAQADLILAICQYHLVPFPCFYLLLLRNVCRRYSLHWHTSC